MSTRIPSILFLFSLCLAPAIFAADAAKKEKPKVEVCFVLDTTGSMQGLIDGAKAKIWAIANQIIKRQPTPEVRFALIGYRDRGDEYVTKRFDLTDDLDAIYKHLSEFKADGGGDTPESVNQALNEAVNKIAWSDNRAVLKIIFLVGDAPPHMDYNDDKKYPDICKEAAKKDLIINTIQCGEIAETAPIWQEIARKAEGEYAKIGQTGDVVVINAPQDKEIAELNTKLGTTLVPVALGADAGGAASFDAAKKEVEAKQSHAEAAPASVAADRLSYNARSGKAVQGGNIELLDAITSGTVKVADLKDEQLPPEMRKMTKEQREAFVAEKKKEREAIQSKLSKLARDREDYIAGEKKRLADKGKKDAFDEKVEEIITRQAEAKQK